MKKNLKTIASIALLSTLTFASVSTIQPKPANALAGLAFASPITMIVGGSITGLGLLSMGVGAVGGRDCSQWGCMGPGLMLLGGLVVSFVGLIVLEDQTVQFGHMSESQAIQAGLTHTEWMSYEGELAEINAVLEEQLMERKTELEKTGEILVENAMSGWSKAGEALSAESFTAIKKIAARAVKSAQANR